LVENPYDDIVFGMIVMHDRCESSWVQAHFHCFDVGICGDHDSFAIGDGVQSSGVVGEMGALGFLGALAPLTASPAFYYFS